MFEPRDLPADLAAVGDEHAPGALVFDTERDFETLSPEVAENLGLVVDAVDPASYPDDWLPPDPPDLLRRYASEEFTVGMPGDGGVAWTRQTSPPVVLVKPRLRGSPEDFVDFLIAEAFVQIGLGEPEHFLGFFDGRYPAFDDAVGLDPADTYQLAAALYEAYLGLQTREVFAAWGDEHPRLFAAWQDAGERLEPRLGELMSDVATGKTAFADAAELACNGIKHALEPPAPFAALDTAAYGEHGAEYAVRWAEKTLERFE